MTFLFFEGMSERNYISLIFITTGENGSSDYRLELFCVTTFKQRRSRCTGFKDEKKTCYLYYSDFKQTYKRLHPPGFFWADSVVIVSLNAEGPRLKVHKVHSRFLLYRESGARKGGVWGKLS